MIVAGVDPILLTDAKDRSPLIAVEDMILRTIGIIGHILDPAHRIGYLPGDATGLTHLMTIIRLNLTIEGTGIGPGHILDPAHRIGHLPGDVTGLTHLMIVIPLNLTIEGTGIGPLNPTTEGACIDPLNPTTEGTSIGQFLGAFHRGGEP